ncbi:MAG TPA: hypothetical protein VFV49_14910 [Thermoanaerobaculia bacterium]|nr:hypothetical protein [Thermoanaerobaculia bacterium]
MLLKTKLKDPNVLMRVGLVVMLLAHASLWFLAPRVDFWRGFVDGVTGALFGISFACLLLAARINGRRRFGA